MIIRDATLRDLQPGDVVTTLSGPRREFYVHTVPVPVDTYGDHTLYEVSVRETNQTITLGLWDTASYRVDRSRIPRLPLRVGYNGTTHGRTHRVESQTPSHDGIHEWVLSTSCGRQVRGFAWFAFDPAQVDCAVCARRMAEES